MSRNRNRATKKLGGIKMKTIIRDIRIELDLTREEYASLLGISLSNLYQLESGSPKKINPRVIQALDRLDYDIEEVKEQYQKDRAAKVEKLFNQVK